MLPHRQGFVNTMGKEHLPVPQTVRTRGRFFCLESQQDKGTVLLSFGQGDGSFAGQGDGSFVLNLSDLFVRKHPAYECRSGVAPPAGYNRPLRTQAGGATPPLQGFHLASVPLFGTGVLIDTLSKPQNHHRPQGSRAGIAAAAIDGAFVVDQGAPAVDCDRTEVIDICGVAGIGAR